MDHSDDPLPTRRPGRPKRGAQRRERYCVSLEPRHAESLRVIGGGLLSEGIARTLELYEAVRADETVNHDLKTERG
jgi:hypothetical protein